MFSLFSFFYAYARPLIKWFLRRFTRLCELQRICYGAETASQRKKGVEQSLQLSRRPRIKDVVQRLNDSVDVKMNISEFQDLLVPFAVSTVLSVKKVKSKIHPDFAPALSECIETIWSYRRLCSDIENLRKMPYDSNNLSHEETLMKLWQLLMPNQPLEARISKQWLDIGFQGDNPMTDFRGMGYLGLENLVYFAEEYTEAARYVLSHASHPVHGYTFAIVGINLTSLAYTLLHDGPAKTHLYNLKTRHLSAKHFHRMYSFLFYEFDRFWMECKPSSLMEFPDIYARFMSDILTKLSDERTIFNINFAVADI